MCASYKMSSRVRPRESNNTNGPPKKKQKLMVDKAVLNLARNFNKKLNTTNTVYNFGTVERVGNVDVTIRLSRKLINDFRAIYKKSFDNQIEYAGSVRFNAKNTRGLVKFNRPTQSTNYNFKVVTPKPQDLSSYIVYHSHPVPQSNTKLVTIPSDKDFAAYINFYPYVQANIILEKYGYYVIDLIESDRFKKPNPKQVHQFFMSEVYGRGDFEKYKLVHRNIMFFKVEPKSLQRVINGYTDARMRQQFGISVRYYLYDDDLPKVTLMDRSMIMIE